MVGLGFNERPAGGLYFDGEGPHGAVFGRMKRAVVVGRARTKGEGGFQFPAQNRVVGLGFDE
jgi:hypothetical protein